MAEFEERADQLSLEDIDATLCDGEIFKRARKKLLAPGAKLLVGPRGTGKTHLMRYTYLHAMRNQDLPLALYANFSRYLNLEPLLKKSADALQRFHSWVLAKIVLSAFDFVNDLGGDPSFLEDFSRLLTQEDLRRLVSLLERSSGTDEYEKTGRYLTVELVLGALNLVQAKYKRSRTVLLLDDAALSLAEQYLISFFEIYRLLKTDTVAPKASVYPGSTQYGPSFHASHEAEPVSLWLSVDDLEYVSIMGDIAAKRFSGGDLSSVNPEVQELLKYIAFGSPRAYLRLIRSFLNGDGGSPQARVNRVIDDHVDLMGIEYDSLGLKLRQFSSVIEVGRKFFDRVNAELAAAQDLGVRNIVLGLHQSSDRTPLADRMLLFLVEVGLLYPMQSVSHGANRRYDRFIPHLAFLYKSGVFRVGRGTSFRDLPPLSR